MLLTKMRCCKRPATIRKSGVARPCAHWQRQEVRQSVAGEVGLMFLRKSKVGLPNTRFWYLCELRTGRPSRMPYLEDAWAPVCNDVGQGRLPAGHVDVRQKQAHLTKGGIWPKEVETVLGGNASTKRRPSPHTQPERLRTMPGGSLGEPSCHARLSREPSHKPSERRRASKRLQRRTPTRHEASDVNKDKSTSSLSPSAHGASPFLCSEGAQDKVWPSPALWPMLQHRRARNNTRK